jgi:sRNA-binding regulator protein Hfq
MKFNTVQDLFNYLSSLERSSIQILKNSCTIWLSNGVVLNGKAVEEIDRYSKDLIDNETSFVYTINSIASIDSFRMENFVPTPESFLNTIFNLYPEIIPIEYSLSVQLSAFEQALREMQILRIQVGKLKSEFDDVQNKMFELQREKEFFDGNVSELTENCHRKSKQLVEVWIPLIKSGCLINIVQMRAIDSFVRKDSATYKIFINTGYLDNTVRLKYQITAWGSADLSGIPVGTDNAITFFNQDGQQTGEVPRDSGQSFSIDWDELKILLEYFESKV